METMRASRTLALLALTILGAACETGTDPLDGEAFQEALDSYEALDRAFASAAWEGFQALDGRTPFSGSAAALEVVASLGEPGFARRLAAGPSAAPIISDTHRGRTLVYDPTLDRYQIDASRTGAPPTGVRFVLYQTDAAGEPVVAQEIGHADLIDEGDGSAADVALLLRVVADGATVIEYRTTADERSDGGALTVKGFVEGEDDVRLDFDIEATGRRGADGGRLDVAFELAVDARDFSITGDVRGARAGAEGEGEVDLTVRHGDDSFRVDFDGENGAVEGTVFVNGDIFATATGDAGAPTLLGRSGEPLTGVELLVLQRIADGAEDVFDLLEDLVDPVDDLVLLGAVL